MKRREHVLTNIVERADGFIFGFCSVCGASSRVLKTPKPTKKNPEAVIYECVTGKLKEPKGSKYLNKPTVTVSGKSFQSEKEARRYEQLNLLEKGGEITNLKTQVTFRLNVNGVHVCKYIADFVYEDKNGKTVVEDVKGLRTPVYALKKKLMKAVHEIKIKEVT